MGNDDSAQLGGRTSGDDGPPPPGGYIIWVADREGKLIGPPTDADPARQPDPTRPDAVELYFELRKSADPPPQEQQALQAGIGKALRLCQQRFLDGAAPQADRFRIHFIRLFRIAQIGLQGEHVLTGAASAELAHLAAELHAVANETGAGAGAGAGAGELLPQPAHAASVPVPKGAYIVWVTDAEGNLIHPPSREKPDIQPDPGDPRAVDMYFSLLELPEPPPKDQFALQIEIDKVLRTCQRLYLNPGALQAAKFRIYFTRLFRLAQLGLQGEHPLPEIAASALATVAADLVDDEGGSIKNGYLAKLGFFACAYSAVPLALYVLLRLLPQDFTTPWLHSLNVDRDLLSCFLLLWTGCFLGVWLSYGIRKTKFTLADLTSSDQDRLAPQIRLLFAGLLTMLIGILLVLDLIQLSIGSVSLTAITSYPLLAFMVGAFCGISELSLPASIGNRATTIIKP